MGGWRSVSTVTACSIETVFERVIADPDSLADDPEDRDSPLTEVWDLLIHDIYAARTGRELPVPARGPTDPAGTRIDVNDPAAVARRFPRLAVLVRPEPAPSAVPRPVDAHPQLCPRCQAAMAAHTVGHAARDSNGDWEHAPREYRRCDACRGIAWRWQGEAGWRPADDDPTQHHFFDAMNNPT